jgi:fatty acid desaturase
MSDPYATDPARTLEPVQSGEEEVQEAVWTRRLVLFLRAMSVLSMAKGLYHWAVVCGFAGPVDGFLYQPTPWQTATVFFAVIDLVAAVGLWLAAAWGAVIWLTAGVSMAAVEVFFPQVYGGRWMVVAIEGALLFSYLFLAIQSAREHPN